MSTTIEPLEPVAPPALQPAAPSGVCPGEANLMHGNEPRYLRVQFGLYWDGAPVGFDHLYFPDSKPFALTVAGIAALENDASLVFARWWRTTRLDRVLYLGFTGIEMSTADVEAEGWRVVGAAPEA